MSCGAVIAAKGGARWRIFLLTGWNVVLQYGHTYVEAGFFVPRDLERPCTSIFDLSSGTRFFMYQQLLFSHHFMYRIAMHNRIPSIALSIPFS